MIDRDYRRITLPYRNCRTTAYFLRRAANNRFIRVHCSLINVEEVVDELVANSRLLDIVSVRKDSIAPATYRFQAFNNLTTSKVQQIVCF